MTRFQRLATRWCSIAVLGLACVHSSGPASAGHHGKTYEAIQGYTLQQATFTTIAVPPSAGSTAAVNLKAVPLVSSSPASMQVIPMVPLQMVPISLVPIQPVATAPAVAAPAPAPVQVQAVSMVPVTFTMQAVSAAPVASTTSTVLVATPIQILVPQSRKCCPLWFCRHHH